MTPQTEIRKTRFYIVRHLEDGKREVIRHPTFASWREAYAHIKNNKEYDGETSLGEFVFSTFFVVQGKNILKTKRLHNLIPEGETTP